jgi:hypothetical protein
LLRRPRQDASGATNADRQGESPARAFVASAPVWGTVMPRLVKVSMWELTDQEREDAAAAADATDPGRAATFRNLKDWLRTHHLPKIEERDRTYMVLR